ncbi:MAG: alpha/beta hydrolase-fold protein [Bacteroidota bacterium]
MKKKLRYVLIFSVIFTLGFGAGYLVFEKINDLFKYGTNLNLSKEGAVITTLKSNILHEKRELKIYLPTYYKLDQQKNYPVLYVLDGESQARQLSDKLRVLAAVGKVPETIVVGIINTKRTRDFAPSYVRYGDKEQQKNGKADRFLRFITEEVHPFIDQNYRLKENQQMLFGHSWGGVFCTYTLLERPNFFQAIFAHSPSFWAEDGIMIKKIDEFLSQRELPSTFFFMSLGEEESSEMEHFYEKADTLLNSKIRPPMILFTERTRGADHKSTPDIASIRAFIEWGEYYQEK